MMRRTLLFLKFRPWAAPAIRRAAAGKTAARLKNGHSLFFDGGKNGERDMSLLVTAGENEMASRPSARPFCLAIEARKKRPNPIDRSVFGQLVRRLGAAWLSQLIVFLSPLNQQPPLANSQLLLNFSQLFLRHRNACK